MSRSKDANNIKSQIYSMFNELNVDKDLIQLVVNPKRVCLYGCLRTFYGSDYTLEEVQNLKSKLEVYGQVFSHLENWDLNGGVAKIFRIEDANVDAFEETCSDSEDAA